MTPSFPPSPAGPSSIGFFDVFCQFSSSTNPFNKETSTPEDNYNEENESDPYWMIIDHQIPPSQVETHFNTLGLIGASNFKVGRRICAILGGSSQDL